MSELAPSEPALNPAPTPSPEISEFAHSFAKFLDWVNATAHLEDRRNEVVVLVRDHLGADGARHSVVTRDLPPFEHVNLQTAINAWSTRDGRTVEVRGMTVPLHYGGLTLQNLVTGDGLRSEERRVGKEV